MVLINDNSKVLKIGDSMPHFKLPAANQWTSTGSAHGSRQATDGMTVDSKMIKDPVLCVIFTCNHCPYALGYEDRIIALAEDFDEEGTQFVLINSNDAANYPEDSFENMKVRAKEKSYPFPYCFDEDQSVAKSYGALCTPHCFVFDRARKLKYKGRVDDNWKDPKAVTESNLHDAIQALVNDKEPPVHEANAIGCSIKWRE